MLTGFSDWKPVLFYISVVVIINILLWLLQSLLSLLLLVLLLQMFLLLFIVWRVCMSSTMALLHLVPMYIDNVSMSMKVKEGTRTERNIVRRNANFVLPQKFE